MKDKNVGYAKGHLLIRDATVHPEWVERIRSTIPSNLCLRKHYHSFIGGFPEDSIFTNSHEDVAYMRVLASFFIEGQIDATTVEYNIARGGPTASRLRTMFSLPPGAVPIETVSDEQEQYIRRHIQKLRQQQARMSGATYA